MPGGPIPATPGNPPGSPTPPPNPAPPPPAAPPPDFKAWYEANPQYQAYLSNIRLNQLPSLEAQYGFTFDDNGTPNDPSDDHVRAVDPTDPTYSSSVLGALQNQLTGTIAGVSNTGNSHGALFSGITGNEDQRAVTQNNNQIGQATNSFRSAAGGLYSGLNNLIWQTLFPQYQSQAGTLPPAGGAAPTPAGPGVPSPPSNPKTAQPAGSPDVPGSMRPRPPKPPKLKAPHYIPTPVGRHPGGVL